MKKEKDLTNLTDTEKDNIKRFKVGNIYKIKTHFGAGWDQIKYEYLIKIIKRSDSNIWYNVNKISKFETGSGEKINKENYNNKIFRSKISLTNFYKDHLGEEFWLNKEIAYNELAFIDHCEEINN